jgi:hypothetical protein
MYPARSNSDACRLPLQGPPAAHRRHHSGPLTRAARPPPSRSSRCRCATTRGPTAPRLGPRWPGPPAAAGFPWSCASPLSARWAEESCKESLAGGEVSVICGALVQRNGLTPSQACRLIAEPVFGRGNVLCRQAAAGAGRRTACEIVPAVGVGVGVGVSGGAAVVIRRRRP